MFPPACTEHGRQVAIHVRDVSPLHHRGLIDLTPDDVSRLQCQPLDSSLDRVYQELRKELKEEKGRAIGP